MSVELPPPQDPRPVPIWYRIQLDKFYNRWFYVNVREKPPRSSWLHPADELPPPPVDERPTSLRGPRPMSSLPQQQAHRSSSRQSSLTPNSRPIDVQDDARRSMLPYVQARNDSAATTMMANIRMSNLVGTPESDMHSSVKPAMLQRRSRPADSSA